MTPQKERRKSDAYMMNFFESWTEESRKDREGFSRELKELAQATDRKIETLALTTTKKIDRLTEHLDAQIRTIFDTTRPDKKLWLQFGALIVSLFVVMGALVTMSQKVALGPLENEIVNVRHNLAYHIEDTSHDTSVLNDARHEERFTRIFDALSEQTEKITGLDEKVQTEMRILDAAIKREMTLTNDRTRARLERIEVKTGISTP